MTACRSAAWMSGRARGTAALRATAAAALTALGLGLGACSSDDDGPQIVCPPVRVISDADRLVRFDGGSDLTDVDFEARLDEPLIACTFNEDDYAIESELQLRFLVSRGPNDADHEARFEYFVAITTAIGQRVVAREEFGLFVPFEGNQTQLAVTDEVTPRIPLRSTQTGAEYLVYVGFKLTEPELEFNRGGG